MRRQGRRRLAAVLLAGLTVVLLNVSFAPLDAWPVAYGALVPWVLALAVAPTRRWALLCGWLGGWVFWLVSLYWLTWITMLGYVAGTLYVSLFWLAAAAVVRAAMGRNWPLWIVLPVVWVALEFLRGHVTDLYLGPSFPWFYLAHTQYAQTRLIQIADLTGQYGVSFFVGMVNGLLLDAASSRWLGERRLRGRLILGGSVTAATCAALLLYGTYRLGEDTRRPGPVIGIVQEAIPISLAGRSETPEDILDLHLAATARFVGKAPDLVIWPETMLPRGLNRELLDVDVAKLEGDGLRSLGAWFFGPEVWLKGPNGTYKHDDETLRAYLGPVITGGGMPKGEVVPGRRGLAAKVYRMAERLGCPLLAGGSTIHRNPRPIDSQDQWVIRNGAVWFAPGPDANDAPVYAKRFLVPFSEYVPFKQSFPGLHRLLRRCVPAVMEQIDPGPDWTEFVLRRPTGQWRLVSPICYEGTFADVCRAMVYRDGAKRADILANLSNDGWFVYRHGAGHRGSTEHAQHLSHYVFRAIESRVPVVRAVNTGISASIDSNGRIVAVVCRRLRDDVSLTMVSGALLLDGAEDGHLGDDSGHGPRILVDSRISWYSRFGDVFALTVGVFAAVLAGWLAWKRPKKKERVQN